MWIRGGDGVSRTGLVAPRKRALGDAATYPGERDVLKVMELFVSTYANTSHSSTSAKNASLAATPRGRVPRVGFLLSREQRCRPDPARWRVRAAARGGARRPCCSVSSSCRATASAPSSTFTAIRINLHLSAGSTRGAGTLVRPGIQSPAVIGPAAGEGQGGGGGGEGEALRPRAGILIHAGHLDPPGDGQPRLAARRDPVGYSGRLARAWRAWRRAARRDPYYFLRRRRRRRRR